MTDTSPAVPPPPFLSTAPGGGVRPAESAELLQATLLGAGAAAWAWNPVSREFRWSAELPALYGLAPATAMTPDLPWRRVHPDDAGPLRQALKDQLAAGDLLDLEYRILAGGEVRWLNTRGRRHDAERVLGITLDITERRRAEQLDAESRRALELVATGAPLETCLDAVTDALGRLHPAARPALLRSGRHGESPMWSPGARFPLSVLAALRDAPGGGVPHLAADNPQPVAYDDVGASADWPEPWHSLAGVYRLRACLAQPVMGDGGHVVATLCLFLDEARAPTAWERRLAAFGAHVAGIALARHQAEAGLRHERERLRAIFEQSVAGIALYDLQGRVVDANERFCDILGRPRAELLGAHMLDVTHPEDRPESEALFASLVDGRLPSFSLEKRYVRADGSVAWVRKDANLVRDAHGHPLHVAAIAADITERHRADERLRLVIDAVPALISYIDADLRYQVNNKAYENWFGHRREEIRGRTMREVLGDASFERLQPYIEAALSGQRVAYEGVAPYRYGGTRHIRAEYVPEVVSDGTVAGFYAFVTDISAQKEAESLVRDSERRLREFADSAPAMLWGTDTDNKLVFISRRWSDHTGQSPEDAYRGGFGWTQMVHPDDRPAVGRRFMEATARRESFELEYRLRCADGSYRWTIDAGRPRFDSDGRWLGFVGTLIDAHEKTEAREALREADRRKDEFLATLAHELRNPLAPIRNALHLLALGGDKQRPPALLEMLDRQVNHLVRLVDDLMEASRISRGKLDLRMEPLDLRDVLRTRGGDQPAADRPRPPPPRDGAARRDAADGRRRGAARADLRQPVEQRGQVHRRRRAHPARRRAPRQHGRRARARQRHRHRRRPAAAPVRDVRAARPRGRPRARRAGHRPQSRAAARADARRRHPCSQRRPGARQHVHGHAAVDGRRNPRGRAAGATGTPERPPHPRRR